ncbi:hypothetical protein ACHAWF_017488 [Thalassiosira exigua]
MASGNPPGQQRQRQQAVVRPPAGGGGGGASAGGLGRSAPIRTLPAGAGGPSSSSSSPAVGPGSGVGVARGVVSTPPLVKSKLSLTPGRGGGGGMVGGRAAGMSGGGRDGNAVVGPAASATGRSARATAASASGPGPSSGAVAGAAYATGKLSPSNPRGKDRRQQQRQPPARPAAPSQPFSQPYAQPPPPPPPPAPAAYYDQYDPLSAAAAAASVAPPPPLADAGSVDSDPISRSRMDSLGDDPRAAPSHVAPALGLPPSPYAAPTDHPLSGAAVPPAEQRIHRADARPVRSAHQPQPHHPLAGPPPPPPPVGAGGAPAASPTQPLATPYRLPPPSSHAAPPPPPPPPAAARGTARPATPDEEVDAFLRGEGSGEGREGANEGGTLRRLRPSPLPASQSPLLQAKTLASRRAWGDVVRVAGDALSGQRGSAGLHRCCHAELVHAAGGAGGAGGGEDDPGSNAGGGAGAPDPASVTSGKEHLDRLRRETSELIALEMTALLKLRRYADLGRECARLGLVPRPRGERGDARGGGGAAPPASAPALASPAASPTSTVGTAETSVDLLSSSPVAAAGAERPAEADDADPLPSWVPFGLRLLAAHQLQYNEGPGRAIDVLYELRERVAGGSAGRQDEAVDSASGEEPDMTIWRPAVDNALANAFVRKREWRLALRSLDDLLAGIDEGFGVNREVDFWCAELGEEDADAGTRATMRRAVAAAARVELRSRQLLILLQSGALPAAEAVQDEVRRSAAEVESLLDGGEGTALLARLSEMSNLVRQVPIRQIVNEGLLRFARREYAAAAERFRDALARQRQSDRTSVAATVTPLAASPNGCPSWKELSSPTLGFDANRSLTAEILNDLSLCLLYGGGMRSAVRELEGLVREDPCEYLGEGLAFNLCTLYELSSEGEECARRKRLLQRVAKRFYLHDVGSEAFRLG